MYCLNGFSANLSQSEMELHCAISRFENLYAPQTYSIYSPTIFVWAHHEHLVHGLDARLWLYIAIFILTWTKERVALVGEEAKNEKMNSKRVALRAPHPKFSSPDNQYSQKNTSLTQFPFPQAWTDYFLYIFLYNTKNHTYMLNICMFAFIM